MPKNRPFRPGLRLKRMDNSLASTRNKFWLVFLALFVFWYLMLYEIDWWSLPGLTSLSHNQVSSRKASFDPTANTYVLENNTVSDVNNVSVTNPSRNPINVSGNDQDSAENAVLKDTKNTSKNESRGVENPCAGRYIYVHDLPSQFHSDLLQQCKSLSKWDDMCLYLSNMGLGPDLGNPQRIFMKSGWYVTHQFSLEVIFHHRMRQYECLTNDSSKAAAVYVPYYAGLDVARYLFDSSNTSVRDAVSLDLINWLRKKPEWKTLWGRDHFMVLGRITWDFRRGTDEDSDWGNKLMILPEAQNMTMLTIESSPWHRNDFAVPYPTYFHPSKDDEVFQWQNRMRRTRRRILFSFVGGARPHMEESIRGEIMEQCIASRRKCKLLECQDKSHNCLKPAYVMKVFQSTDFCLQPSGDSFTRRSTFDTILAGCIPVFFSPGSAYVQYLWHLPKNHKKYSVLISEDDVKAKNVSIESVLSRIPRSEVNAMREEVIKLIPRVVYADPRSKLETLEDAFDLTVKGVLRRVAALRQEMRQGRNSSFSFDEESSWKYYTFGTVEKHEWDPYFVRRPRKNN